MKIAVMAMAAGVLFTACGSTNKATTPAQKSASARGAKLEKEECEEKAMESVKAWRASGNGTSPKEAFARSMAELNAKTRLAQQLEEEMEGLRTSFGRQHEAGGAQELVGGLGNLETGYVSKLLTNVKTICSNTYVKPDGTYNVYVCVEMGEEALSAIHKKLSDDQKLSIDYDEHRFKQEMVKARENYRSNR